MKSWLTSTRRRLFALLSRDFKQIFGQIAFIRVKALSNTNLVASRDSKIEKSSHPVDVCRSKMSLLKLPNISPVSQTFTLKATKLDNYIPIILLQHSSE